MTEYVEPLDAHRIEVFKKRAFLKVISHLQEAYREAHDRDGLSRRQFAERIGMKPSQFSRILNGGQNISVETAEAILRSMNRRMIFGSEDIRDIPSSNSNRTYGAEYEVPKLIVTKEDSGGPGKITVVGTAYDE